MTRICMGGFCAALGAMIALAAPPAGQAAPPAMIPDGASETHLVNQIERLQASLRTDLPLPARFLANAPRLQEIVGHADELLKRYPKSAYRDKALIAKLTALAELSRGQPRFLEQLRSLTDEVSAGNPRGLLASENAYYAIQAFVLGARYEGMPEDRKIHGTIERYEAFLEDYPSSKRRPVIRASLIRSLLASKRTARARAELARLLDQDPNHAATRRAQGEVYRETAVGKPFRLELDTVEGKKMIRPADYPGKVLVVHFWSSLNEQATGQFPELLKLHETYTGRGLQLVGINVDEDRSVFEEARESFKLPWPQHFQPGGFKSEILIRQGVIRIPTFFVVDRCGILRSADPRTRLPDLIKTLLQEEGANSPAPRAP